MKIKLSPFALHSVVALLLVGLLSHFLWSVTLTAKFGPIDDHEIVEFLGSDFSLSSSQIVSTWWNQTEAGQIQGSKRYRPLYFLLRVLECSLWGNQPETWYFVRIVFFAISLWMTFLLVGASMGLFWGWIALAFFASRDFWIDVVPRLGPCETYGVPLVLLFVLFVKSWIKKGKAASWLALCVISILLCGLKENFIVVLFPLLFIAFLQRKEFKTLQVLGLLLVLSAVIFVTLVILKGLAVGGSDTYGNSVGLLDRFKVFAIALRKSEPFVYLVGILFVLSKFKNQSFLKENWVPLTGIVTLWLVFCSQIVFYNGNWPTSMRYDFPGVICYPVALAILIMKIQTWFPKMKWGMFALGLILLVKSGLHFREQAPLFQQAAARNAQRTKEFDQFLQNAVKVIRSEGDDQTPIVFYSHKVWDYESIFALKRILGIYSISNPISFARSWQSDELQGLELLLARNLEKIEAGEQGFVIFPKNTSCYTIGFNGDGYPKCKNLGVVRF